MADEGAIQRAIGKYPIPEVGPKEALAGLLELYSRGVEAPISAGIKAYGENLHRPLAKGPLALKAAFDQLVKYDPPSMGDVGKAWGFSGKTLADVSDRFSGPGASISPASLMGLGMVGMADPLPGPPVGGAARKAAIQRAGKKVFHGSPHKFSKFDIEKIGTGEGAQAFGHGLYFTDAPEIAEGYAKGLSTKDLIRNFRKELPDDADFNNVMELVDTGHFSPEQDAVLKALADDDWLGFDYPSQAISAAYKDLDAFDSSPALQKAISDTKHLYTARIPEGDYIDWQKPVSEKQLNKVKKYLRDSWKPEKMGVSENDRKFMLEVMEQPNFLADNRGESLYIELAGFLKSPQKASKILNKAGIKGVEYPAGTLSGIKGSKAKNYVVFSDEGISVEDIKKLMLLGGAGVVGAGAINE